MYNKMYIAGPMTGYKDFNFPAFNKAEKELTALGYEVINPAKLTDGDTSKPWLYYMRHSIGAMMGCCNKICLLEGWEKSKGARIEFVLAESLGFELYKQFPEGYGRVEVDWEVSAR